VRQPQSHGSWFSFGGGVEARVSITLPAAMPVNFGTGSGDVVFNGVAGDVAVRGHTGSGDVTVRGGAARIDITSGSGDQLVVIGKPARHVQLHAGSGDIRFSGPAAELETHTGSGDTTASGLTGAARAETGSGDVRLSWANGPTAAAIAVRTGSGDAIVTLPRAMRLRGAVSTGSGDIDSDFAGRSDERGREMVFAGPRGSVPVAIKTGSGDVALRHH